MDATCQREWLFLAVVAAAAALLAGLHPLKAIDYRVYWENAHHYFRDGQPMYGPASGTGWAGGVYRYPPVFLDLFRPLAALPLRWGAVLWAVGKIAVGGALAIRLRRRWQAASLAALWPGLLLIAPYFIQELRYGNAQFYIVAAVIAAFLEVDEHPLRGGFWLGFAAALKLWPLFFFPFWMVQRRWRGVAAASGAVLGWTLLPALWRGWGAQGALLGQWLAQERAIAGTNARLGELWYPGQSLHDVMARFLSVINYSQMPDAHYPQVAWLHWTASTVEHVWWAVMVVLLVGLFWMLAAQRANETEAQRDTGAALLFCAVMVAEPHVHRLILETLLWPALWLAAARARGRIAGIRAGWFWLAVAVAAIQPLIPGAARQRGMQAYGVDFWLVLLPLTALCAAEWWRRSGGRSGGWGARVGRL